MVASAPSAADSVGVARPPDIAPRTTTKIETTGSTSRTSSSYLAQPDLSSRAVAGASAGFALARTMMYPTNATLSIRPGTTPPISSFEIETPDRLPSSTVRAEGGISMSTASIAMIGPVASTGLYPRDSMTGSINDPSMAVVAIVEPEMAENTVPATTATTASRPGT